MRICENYYVRAAGWLYIGIYYIYARNTIATLILRRRRECNPERAVAVAVVGATIVRAQGKHPSVRATARAVAPSEPNPF